MALPGSDPRRKASRRRGVCAGALLCALVVSLVGCSGTANKHNYLTSYDNLKSEKKFGGAVLSNYKSVVPIKSPIILDQIVFAQDVKVDGTLSDRDRDLLLNVFGRGLCRNLAKYYAIVPRDTSGAYKLRAAITEVKATAEAASAVSAATGLLIPIPAISIRLPIGMGSLTTEMELIDPQGKQAAAMVLHRQPNLTTSASVSKIGDAYNFADDAGKTFAVALATAKEDGDKSGNDVKKAAGKDPVSNEVIDVACAAYGKANRALGFVQHAIPLPPTAFDKGKPLPKGQVEVLPESSKDNPAPKIPYNPDTPPVTK